jgi:hypothetical protein
VPDKQITVGAYAGLVEVKPFVRLGQDVAGPGDYGMGRSGISRQVSSVAEGLPGTGSETLRSRTLGKVVCSDLGVLHDGRSLDVLETAVDEHRLPVDHDEFGFVAQG